MTDDLPQQQDRPARPPEQEDGEDQPVEEPKAPFDETAPAGQSEAPVEEDRPPAQQEDPQPGTSNEEELLPDEAEPTTTEPEAVEMASPPEEAAESLPEGPSSDAVMAEEPAVAVEADEPAVPAEVEEPAVPAEVEEPAIAPDEDPFSGPGDWYVIHTYAGYENKVRDNLTSRIQSMQMQDKIFEVVVPMEDVMEIKGGRKQVVKKKVFPGYLLVKMEYDNDSWFVVRNTPGVTGFVSSGTGQKPTPLSRREVEKILVVKKEETKPAFRLEFEEGDVVRIISGPFADFNGTIDEINLDQSKVKVMVNIFDRETPVELSFDQVARV
jgi:transcriptional antiterminator NusG